MTEIRNIIVLVLLIKKPRYDLRAALWSSLLLSNEFIAFNTLNNLKVNLNEVVIEYDLKGNKIRNKTALELVSDIQNSEIKQMLLCKL